MNLKKKDGPPRAKDKARARAYYSSMPSSWWEVHCIPDQKLGDHIFCSDQGDIALGTLKAQALTLVEGPCLHSKGTKFHYVCSWKVVFKSFSDEQDAKECFWEEMQRPKHHGAMLDLVQLDQREKNNVLQSAMRDFSHHERSSYRDEGIRRRPKHGPQRRLTARSYLQHGQNHISHCVQGWG